MAQLTGLFQRGGSFYIRILLPKDHFQIHPQGNLIRTGSGLWGLADRDVKVNDPETMLDQLVSHLQSTQEGIHSSEVAEILGNIDEGDAQALLGLINGKGIQPLLIYQLQMSVQI